MNTTKYKLLKLHLITRQLRFITYKKSHIPSILYKMVLIYEKFKSVYENFQSVLLQKNFDPEK